MSVLLVLCMVIPIVPMGTKEVWAESTIISLDVPLYAQSKNYTCADASSRMCIGYYFGLGYNTGKSSTIPSEDALVSNYGYGSHTPIVKGISEYCGISYKYISKQSTVSAFEDYIYSQLIDGKPVVLNVYSKKNEYLGYPTPNGHYIVVTGMQKSNSETILYINDPFSPSSYSGQGYKPQKITPKISDVYKTVQYMDGEQDGKIIQDKRCKHDSDYKKKGLCGDCGAWNTSFTKASVNTGYYTTNTDTNLKSQPYAVCDNTNGKSTAVPKGKTVKVVEAYYNALGNNDDHLWYKVVYNGESGYIFSKRLTYKSAAPNNAEKYHLDVNGLLDGSNAGNVSGYGKFDIYINGKLSTNKTDYYEELYYGTTYEITNIRAEDGCVYNGVTEGKIKGTVTDSDIVIRLSFEERILPKVYFDAQGGAFGTVLTSKLDGINTGRKEGQLILYNEAGTQHDTTVYGNEIAVGADGRITDIRRYGVKTLLTVPSGGFVLSGHSAWDSNAGQSYGGGVFVSSILELSDPYVRANRKTNEAIAYDGYDAYLADGKYYQETASCLELPVPKRDGYYFAGWYNSNGQRMYYNSVLSDTELTARWTTDPQPVASTTYNGHSYDVFDYNMSWLEAKAFCESRGGHLVSITSDGEQQAVLNAILLGNLNLYYIGASDAETEGSWKWVDGETFDYDNWDKGAPEPNGKTKENYACIINTSYGPYKTAGEWIDCPNVTNGGFYTCSNTGFICEYDSYEPVPQTELFGLHVTAYVDGIITEDLQGVGSFDVYLNGELSVDDISYFSSQWRS